MALRVVTSRPAEVRGLRVVRSSAVAVISSDALVLRTYKIGESSKVVVLLTRDRGKLRAVARGARGPRSRYRSSLGLYGRQGAELLRRGPCELIRSAFRASGRGLESSMTLQYLAELVDAFAQEGEPEEKVYRLVCAVIGAADGGAAPEMLRRYLEAWLLRLQGIYPPLDRCAACGLGLPAGRLRYHDAARGFVCDDCGPVSGPVLSLAGRIFLEQCFSKAPADLKEPSPAEAMALEAFHQDLITRHLERAPRSQRVIKDVARGVK